MIKITFTTFKNFFKLSYHTYTKSMLTQTKQTRIVFNHHYTRWNKQNQYFDVATGIMRGQNHVAWMFCNHVFVIPPNKASVVNVPKTTYWRFSAWHGASSSRLPFSPSSSGASSLHLSKRSMALWKLCTAVLIYTLLPLRFATAPRRIQKSNLSIAFLLSS